MGQQYQRGDTIIEMVMAFAIFAIAAIGTLTVLNKGVATTQRNLEITLVREQIDSQAEMIRYAHNTQSPAWDAMIASSSLVATPLALDKSCTATSAITNGFFLQPNINTANPSNTQFTRKGIASTTFKRPDTYAKIDYTGAAAVSSGIWVQATRAQQGGSVSAYDFYIHACWDSAGLATPMTLGTIVRVYE